MSDLKKNVHIHIAFSKKNIFFFAWAHRICQSKGTPIHKSLSIISYRGFFFLTFSAQHISLNKPSANDRQQQTANYIVNGNISPSQWGAQKITPRLLFDSILSRTFDAAKEKRQMMTYDWGLHFSAENFCAKLYCTARTYRVSEMKYQFGLLKNFCRYATRSKRLSSLF